MNTRHLTALFQLASPALPVGGFSYSQGLESAVAEGLVSNESDAQEWISGILTGSFASAEGALWVVLHRAWQSADIEQVTHWNQWFWASRETHEFRMETEQMGWSLVKLAQELCWGDPTELDVLSSIRPITYPCAHAYVCSKQGVDDVSGLTAYVFSWLENQVMAAMKSIPLGQVSGQKILQQAAALIPSVISTCLDRARAEPPRINTFSHQLAVLSSRHETQYSRLFRS